MLDKFRQHFFSRTFLVYFVAYMAVGMICTEWLGMPWLLASVFAAGAGLWTEARWKKNSE